MVKASLWRSVLLITGVISGSNAYAAHCEFNVTNEWGSGFTSSVTITNDTGQAINGWNVVLEFTDGARISGVWSSSSTGSNPYNISNASWNGSIQPGSAVSFGFNSQKGNEHDPVIPPNLGGICTSGDISAPEPEPEPTEASCEFAVTADWNSGFTSSIKITNTANVAINGWTVSIQFPDNPSISNMWNATFTGNNPWQASNVNYNQVIAAGSTVEFGFNSNKAFNNAPVQTPSLGGICGETIAVNGAPEASASADSTEGFAPLTVGFDGSASSDPDNHSLSYSWDFGDGNTGSGAAASHTFSAPGSYTVTLTVDDGNGGTDTDLVVITVNEPVIPNAWTLDTSTSSLHFVSTKKVHAIETHTFTQMSGSIGPDGSAVVTLDLASVETGIETRNERMRNFLFETGTFPSATISLGVDMAALANIAVGDSLAQTISPTVDLHGVSIALDIPVSITKLSDTRILVRNTSPILVQAADFSLVDGVETLRSLANLSSISYAVPTNFTLLFNQQQ